MTGELDAGAGQFGVERFCPEAGGEVPAQPLAGKPDAGAAACGKL